MDGLWRDVAVGTVGAWVATKVMERVGGFIYERQSDASKRREEQLRPDPMPPITLVRKIADLFGQEVDDQRAESMGTWIHYGFGLVGGPAAAAIRHRRQLGGMSAGLVVGLGMALVVDEGLNYALGLVPPAPEWPAASHLRGVVTHVAYGLTLGAVLTLGDALGCPRD